MTNLINIVQGIEHDINVNVITGTPPYTFKIYRASGFDITDPTKFIQIETTYVGSPTETFHKFIHTFDESVGNYTIKGEVIDSCSLSPKIGSGIYNVTIIETPILTNITISPTGTSINLGDTQQLTATCKDQIGNIITCPTLIWSSSNTSIAKVNSSGLVTGVATGTANITASSGSIISNTSIIYITTITTNMVKNASFENVDPADSTKPQYWTKYSKGTISSSPWKYPETGRDGKKCIATDFGPTTYSGEADWVQNIPNLSAGKNYTITAYMKVVGISATSGYGAIIKIDWFNASGGYISSSYITPVTGNVDWRQYSGTFKDPTNTANAYLDLQLNKAKGKVYFDDIVFQ